MWQPLEDHYLGLSVSNVYEETCVTTTVSWEGTHGSDGWFVEDFGLFITSHFVINLCQPVRTFVINVLKWFSCKMNAECSWHLKKKLNLKQIFMSWVVFLKISNLCVFVNAGHRNVVPNGSSKRSYYTFKTRRSKAKYILSFSFFCTCGIKFC